MTAEASPDSSAAAAAPSEDGTSAAEGTASEEQTSSTAQTTSLPETTKAPETTEKPAETTEKPFDPQNPVFREADYHGAPFTVLAREASTYSQVAIVADDLYGDVYALQTLARNSALESAYGVSLRLLTEESPKKILEKDLLAGAVTYDLVLESRVDLSQSMQKGELSDWNSLGIPMEAPWWDANCVKGYDVNGKLYLAVNDVSINNLSCTRFVYFNPALIAKYQLENPYDLVDRGQWTLDRFIALGKAAAHPSKDETVLGEYGILQEVGSQNGTHMQLFTGCDVSYVKWVDGKLCSALDTKTVNKLQTVTDKLKDFLTASFSLTYNDVDKVSDTSPNLNKFDKGRNSFAEGHFLFLQNTLNVAEQFQNMPQGVGIVPNPLYDSAQKNYCHMVDKYALIWAIPNAVSVDKERVGTVSDYWAYLSAATVMEFFLERNLSNPAIDRDAARKNLHIIKNSIVYNLGDLLDLGIPNMVDSGFVNRNISLAVSRESRSVEKKLETVNQALKQLSD